MAVISIQPMAAIRISERTLMTYTYSDRQLREWPDASQAAHYWERAQHWEHNANYWKHRALSAEQRMLEHECQEDN